MSKKQTNKDRLEAELLVLTGFHNEMLELQVKLESDPNNSNVAKELNNLKNQHEILRVNYDKLLAYVTLTSSLGADCLQTIYLMNKGK